MKCLFSEEIDEPPEQGIFREVSEVRFPAEVGPLGTHRLCKIKCIDGMWQGPLCAAPDESESGLLKFEPLYRRCVVDQIPPHLLLSYKNVSVVSWISSELLEFKAFIPPDPQLGSPAWTHSASSLRRSRTLQARRWSKSSLLEWLVGSKAAPVRSNDSLDELFRRQSPVDSN